MIVGIKIQIENLAVLGNYGNLLEAFAAKNSSLQTKATTKVEEALETTLFRGIRVQSSAGQGNPDFQVTDDGLNSLLKNVAKTGDEMSNFNSFISDLYESRGGTMVEAKIMRTNTDKNIKLGIFTPSLNNDAFKYMDFTSGDIIDTTKFSVTNALRQSMKEEGSSDPQLKKNLPENIKPADISSFLKKASPQFQMLIKEDENVAKLSKILAKGGKEKQSSDEISALVKKINETWGAKTLEAELTRISKTGKLFDYVKGNPALDSQFYNKSRYLSIIRHDGAKANALLLYFPYSYFTSQFFGAKYEEGVIKVFIKSDVEKMFLESLKDQTASLYLRDSLEEYDAAVKKLAASGTFKTIVNNTFNTEIKYLVPTGGSIPMSSGKLPRYKANFFKVNRQYSRQPKYETGNENITKYDEKMFGTFLSSEFLSLLVRQKVIKTMPHGPIGGRPLSDEMLTYRTGRFANSIQLLVDYKNRMVKYYYNPIYYIHEATSRRPSELIKNSINDVMRERFSTAFNISEIRG